jgi:hypothetical protein
MTRFRLYGFTMVVVLAAASLAAAQSPDNGKDPLDPEYMDKGSPPAHLELPRDPYVPVPRVDRLTTPPARVTYGRYTAVQVNVDAQGNNIVGDAANEPSIAVDPTNGQIMVIGWRQFDTISSDFRQAGWAYSHNGGQTWTFPGRIEPGVFRSDPVVDADSSGNFYYNSLTNVGGFQCKVFISDNGGLSWDGGHFAQGGDKQWQVIDTTGGVGDGHIYASWNEFYSICNGHFTRSTDGGYTFEACTSAPGSPYWGTLAVGPDGELFLCGAGFTVVRSTNAKFAGTPISWDVQASPSLGGSMEASAGPNPGGLLGQCWIDVDRSTGPTRGNVYLLCSVDPPGSDPLDVMFARSTNGGVSWSAPIRVNDDALGTNAWQWFGTMSVAPNGRIDAIWLDTRNDPGGYDSQLFYASSDDAGLTFSTNDVLTPSFDPHVGWPQQNKMGDYFDMASDELGADVAFAGTFNGEQDVYYVRIGERCSRAGSVDFTSPKFGCEGIASMRVNDCDLDTDPNAIDTVTISVSSDSEPAGESVLLQETGVGTATFEGSIPLSATNAPGVVQVVEGDTLTATYVDADNGQGGQNVVVTDTAVIDCTPPILGNIHAENVEARTAEIVFASDEVTSGLVHYGVDCSALNFTSSPSAYATAHRIQLAGLLDGTTYYYAVEAQDEAGNVVIDDNNGLCYTFTTTDVPDFFTEWFQATGNDLDNTTLLFRPNGSIDYYLGCAEPISVLPTNPTGGTTLALSDDNFQAVNLPGGTTVSLYGTSWNRFYVGSNGYITFGAGDTDGSEDFDDHFSLPRISGLFDDLNPAAGGSVSWKLLADRVAVTFLGVPEYSTGGSNTFQIEMYFDGTLAISYLSLSAMDGLAGLSEGNGTHQDFVETDLSAMGDCQAVPPLAHDVSVQTDEDMPVLIVLEAEDDGLPNPPAALTYILTTLPMNGSLVDPGAGPVTSVPYTVAGGGRELVYTPAPGYYGPEAFEWKANDGGTPPEGGDSNTARVFVTINGVPEVVYSFPLDSDPGWATEGLWAFGQPTGGGSWYGDPTAGHTGANVYGYNLAGDYTNYMPAYYLTTTPLDMTGIMGTTLKFSRWLAVEVSDVATVEVSSDGVNWTTVYANADTVSEYLWWRWTYDISAVADDQPAVQIRWGMGPTDGSFVMAGWNIDDVEIWGVPPLPWCRGDANCSGGGPDFADIEYFVAAISGEAAWADYYAAQHGGSAPPCPFEISDYDGGGVSFTDIQPFVQSLGQPCQPMN